MYVTGPRVFANLARFHPHSMITVLLLRGTALLVLCASLVQLTRACGITTHLEVAYRSREHFELVVDDVDYGTLLRRHEDAFQAGASYPDAFYPGLCFGGAYHDIAEDTHWTPFLTEAVTYIRDTYPRPWAWRTQKLVAFLLSVVTHQVSDATWHSLGIDQGFLQAMARTNYHGSFGDAHTAGDFGGDVVNQYNLDTEYIGRLLQWYIPTEDLVAIYSRYYGDEIMTEEIITNCTRWMFLGRLGENIGVINLLYPLYARGSTFLIDRLDDYYLGGQDDMAVWCGNTWQRTVTMLHNGTEVCDLPNNPIYIRCNDETQSDTAKTRRRRDLDPARPNMAAVHGDVIAAMEDMIDRSGLEANDVNVMAGDGGVYMTPGPKVQALLDEAHQFQQVLQKGQPDANETILLPPAFYSSQAQFARMGEVVFGGDVNNDGLDDLIISQPGFSTDLNYMQGAVHIVYGNAEGLLNIDANAAEMADVTLVGSELNGRFGTAVTIVDLNKDGINDLAVSAPWVGSVDLDYKGEVYVYFGQPEGGVASESDVTIACQERYCNLGWSLSTSDLDGDGFGDLVMGSPFAPGGGEQRGVLMVLYAKQQYQGVTTLRLTNQDVDWTFSGQQNYEWLGYSVAGYQSPSSSWLIAGAPMARICARPDCGFDRSDVQAVGRVYVFQGPSNEPANVYEGTEHFEQLGFHVTAGIYADQDVLVLTSATKSVSDGDEIRQAGQVSMYDLTTLDTEPVSVFYGDRPYGRFGAEVLLTDVDGDGRNEVVICAPLRSHSFRNLEEAGRAFVYSTLDTRITTEEADYVLGLEEDNARFGYSAAAVGSSLVFGSPRFNVGSNGRLAGGVARYQLPFPDAMLQ